MRREKTKPQTATVTSCGFVVCLRVLNFTINSTEIFQVFTVFGV